MHFSAGRTKTTLVVAVNNHGRPSRGGDAADFYKVETWGKLAELAGQYLAKGNQVAISGRLMFDRWTDREGKPRVTPVVEASQLSLPPRLKVLDGQAPGDLGQVVANSDTRQTGTLPLGDDDDPFVDDDIDERALQAAV
jgi:single-strand DNA-binding protein